MFWSKKPDLGPAHAPHPPPHELDAASMPALALLLSDERPGVRADAACAIGDRLRTREIAGLESAVQERLAHLLDDREVMVRFEAAVALAEAHHHRATPLLLGAMRSRAVRLDAIRALGAMGDENAIVPLKAFMNQWLLPWADKLQAAAALCALGDEYGAGYLADKLHSRKTAERAAAIHFVGESRHPQARSILEEILANQKDPMRDVAVRALGLLRDPAARPALEAAQRGADPDLKGDIDAALEQLGDQ